MSDRVDHYLGIARSRSSTDRMVACMRLAGDALTDGDALAGLLLLSRDADRDVRWEAAHALTAVRFLPLVRERLEELARDPEEGPRRAALEALDRGTGLARCSCHHPDRFHPEACGR